MANAWYRFYHETLDDPKVQRLPGEIFKGWVNLLSISARNDGVLPDLDSIAFALRKDEKETQELLDLLVEKRLFDVTDNGIEPHNWNGRQYQSDNSTERVKRYREKQRNVSCNVTETANVTPPDTEQIQNRTEVLSGKPDPLESDFAELWKTYPKRDGSNSKQKALAAYRKRRKEKIPHDAIRDGLTKYAAWCQATGKVGTETVMQASRFFGPGREWENEWTPPAAVFRLPTNNRELWEIRVKLGLPMEYENQAQCHEEIRQRLRAKPELRQVAGL